jgi:outer membrane protein assembly factor BamB
MKCFRYASRALVGMASGAAGLCLVGLLASGSAAQADTPLLASNLWTFPFHSDTPADETLSTPAVGPDGVVYVGAFDGRLLALAPDGTQQWQFATGREIRSSPALAEDGTIYFGARDHRFYALTKAGQLKWRFTTGAWVDSSPAIAADGTVYFGSWDKHFYALNPDGSVKWTFAVGGIVDSSPAIGADGSIFFGAHNHNFYSLDAAGQPRWVFRTGAEISSSPALGEDGDVYFTSTDGNLYRLKPDGQEVWRCRVGGGSDGSPVLTENGNVVLAAGYGTVMVSSAGAIVWSWGSPCWLDVTPLATQGTFCFGEPWRMFTARQSDGAEIWRGELEANLTSSPVMGDAGAIYFCAGRSLHALQAPVALLPARSPWPMFRANARHNGRVSAN